MSAEIRRQFQLCADNGIDPRRLSHWTVTSTFTFFPVYGNCAWLRRRNMACAVFACLGVLRCGSSEDP